jgi:dethiobiotin synthase
VLRGLFVTATDTGVGKTVTSAALMHRFRSVAPLRYWKPIQTGIEEDDDTASVRSLAECQDDEVIEEGVRLLGPFSPHLSAALSGRSIDTDLLVRIADRQADSSRCIAEGAGGVLVPLNGRELMIDLIARLGLPVVVVARTTLGTINHTLLTLEALRVRDIEVAGIILVGVPNADNRTAIETYGREPVVGELPPLTPLTPMTLKLAAADLDREGRMLEYLR